MLAVVAILFYVFVYSMWLKRRTSQNIVWGGLAGCMPVIIGWSAVTGDIGWPAWVFFGVIFFWTPPHTWALAMRYREDYAAAGVPMLPVVATEREVVRQIVLYSWAMVACSLLLVPASSWIYAAVAVPLGLWLPGAGPPAAQPGAARRARPADDAVPPLEPVPDRRSRWPGRSTPWSACRCSAGPGRSNRMTEAGGLTGADDAAQVEPLAPLRAEHGGSATAVISYLGRRGARIVAVAADGAFGDAVVSSVDGRAAGLRRGRDRRRRRLGPGAVGGDPVHRPRSAAGWAAA